MNTVLKKQLIFFLILLIIPVLVQAGDYEKYIKSGDLNFRNGKYALAVDDYEKACELKPDEVEAQYKAGKALNFLALEWYGEKKHEYFEEAMRHLTEAVKLDTKKWEAHLELARAIGTAGLFEPNWKQYTLAKRVKEELDIVFKSEDNCADAYYLLGLWHRWVSPRSLLWRKPIGLGDASLEGAIEALKKAISIDDKNLRYKLELAKVYQLNNENHKATPLLNTIISRKPDGELNVQQEYIFRETNKMISELSK